MTSTSLKKPCAPITATFAPFDNSQTTAKRNRTKSPNRNSDASSCTSKKNERHFAYGSLRVALSGVKFFYSVTCKRDWAIFTMLKLQNINALPEVLTIPQVHSIIDAATTQRMRTFLWTVYSMGLRLNEGLHLQVGDIDAARGLTHVHRGKGAKDPYVHRVAISDHRITAVTDDSKCVITAGWPATASSNWKRSG